VLKILISRLFLVTSISAGLLFSHAQFAHSTNLIETFGTAGNLGMVTGATLQINGSNVTTSNQFGAYFSSQYSGSYGMVGGHVNLQNISQNLVFTFPSNQRPTSFSFTSGATNTDQDAFVTYSDSTTQNFLVLDDCISFGCTRTVSFTGNGKSIVSFTIVGKSGTDFWLMDNVSWTAGTVATTLSTPTTPTANPTTGTLKSIAVSWAGDSNASSYTLKLYASNGTTLLHTITGLSSTARTITTSDYASLADGTTYQVSITAIGNGSSFLDSLESAKRSVTTSQTLANASLSTASATSATLKSINLSWSAIANVSSYTIRIYDANDSLLATRTSISGTSKTINSSDLPAIADSTLYKFTIQAIGNNATFLSSNESSKISATTHTPVTVSINRELTNPYSSRSIKYTFTFSETITGFTTSNITLSGTSTGWSKGTLQESDSNYSITITNSSPSDGSINLSLNNTGIAAVSSSVQPPSTNATVFNLGRATQVNTWIKFLWGEQLQRF